MDAPFLGIFIAVATGAFAGARTAYDAPPALTFLVGGIGGVVSGGLGATPGQTAIASTAGIAVGIIVGLTAKLVRKLLTPDE